MPVVRLQQKSYQLEDRVMEGYAMAYRAYLARRDLPGPADLRGLCRNPQAAKGDRRTVVRKLSSSL
jgi:hypothetical protein